jgi:hypothetical protein
VDKVESSCSKATPHTHTRHHHTRLPQPARAHKQGFRGRGGSTTARLDGAVFAASNAALMLAQLGQAEGALKEVRGGRCVVRVVVCVCAFAWC